MHKTGIGFIQNQKKDIQNSFIRYIFPEVRLRNIYKGKFPNIMSSCHSNLFLNTYLLV